PFFEIKKRVPLINELIRLVFFLIFFRSFFRFRGSLFYIGYLLLTGSLGNRLFLSFHFWLLCRFFNDSSCSSVRSGFLLTAASSCRFPFRSRTLFLVNVVVVN